MKNKKRELGDIAIWVLILILSIGTLFSIIEFYNNRQTLKTVCEIEHGGSYKGGGDCLVEEDGNIIRYRTKILQDGTHFWFKTKDRSINFSKEREQLTEEIIDIFESFENQENKTE